MKVRRKNKYNTSPKDKRTCDGILFDSRKEMLYYQELKQKQLAGEVFYFLRQVPFDLPGGVRYRCDFMVVRDLDLAVEFIDVKGVRTDMYKLKKKQVEALYPIEIVEV